jgi:glucose-6-phosphate 1-dehydrogenase
MQSPVISPTRTGFGTSKPADPCSVVFFGAACDLAKVEPAVDHWASHKPHDFPNYAAGSWGPLAAEGLLRVDGREWKTL